MGLTYDASRFLCAMRAADVSFKEMLTLGRQNLMVNAGQLNDIKREFDFAKDATLGDDPYCETFVKGICEAEVVDAADANDYEGAKHVVDMNLPINADLEQTYDIVYDGGTLEHVFQFTIGLANSLRMVKTGGWFVSNTISNGFMGHGFYQFSPELFFRALSASSGFSAPLVVAQSFPTSNLVWGKGGSWYRVSDPEAVKRRVLYAAPRPLALMVAAKKIKHVSEPFETLPQQSDYQALWDESSAHEQAANLRTKLDTVARLPLIGSPLFNLLGKYHTYRYRSTRNAKSFTAMSTAQLTDAIRQVGASA